MQSPTILWMASSPRRQVLTRTRKSEERRQEGSRRTAVWFVALTAAATAALAMLGQFPTA